MSYWRMEVRFGIRPSLLGLKKPVSNYWLLSGMFKSVWEVCNLYHQRACFSVCIFFSSINLYIPLLAPFLGAAGLFLLYKTVDYGKFRKWTVFKNQDGSTAAYLIHCKCSKDEIEKFTECFVETTTKANLKTDWFDVITDFKSRRHFFINGKGCKWQKG